MLKKEKNEIKQLEFASEDTHVQLKEAQDQLYQMKLNSESNNLGSMKEREKYETARKEFEVSHKLYYVLYIL